MLLVDTELRPSAIHGIGVFLLEPIREGQTIWRFDARVDRVYSDAEITDMPERFRHFLKTYSTFHQPTGLWVLCGDNGRHFNHSDTPNTLSRGISFGEDVAAVDLAAGVELTSDYNAICDDVRLNGNHHL